MINSAILRNYSNIACNTSAHLGVSSALGALGQGPNPASPTQLKPSHTIELSRLACLLKKSFLSYSQYLVQQLQKLCPRQLRRINVCN